MYLSSWDFRLLHSTYMYLPAIRPIIMLYFSFNSKTLPITFTRSLSDALHHRFLCIKTSFAGGSLLNYVCYLLVCRLVLLVIQFVLVNSPVISSTSSIQLQTINLLLRKKGCTESFRSQHSADSNQINQII